MAEEMRTQIGDVLLVYFQEKPATYARVEAIRDHERDDWYHCDLLILGVPPGPVSWILRQPQIDGDPFTMGGESVRLERLETPGTYHADGPAPPAPPRDPEPTAPKSSDAKGKVVSLFPKGEKPT